MTCSPLRTTKTNEVSVHYNPRFFSSLFFIFLLPILTGCYNGAAKPADLPKLISCKISVSQDNAPLNGVYVTLKDVNGNQKWFPGGQTNADGVAEISTNGRYKGVPLGKYKVVFSMLESEKSNLPPPPPENDPKYEVWLVQSQAEVLPVYTLIEKQYINENTTPCEIEVVAGKGVVADFNVGKKVREKKN